jgi:hypothetical protein
MDWKNLTQRRGGWGCSASLRLCARLVHDAAQPNSIGYQREKLASNWVVVNGIRCVVPRSKLQARSASEWIRFFCSIEVIGVY